MTQAKLCSTTRSTRTLLFACSFAFALGLSGTALAGGCSIQGVLDCERAERECVSNGRDPALCRSIHIRCMEEVGCEVP